MRTPHRIAVPFASFALLTASIPLAAQPRGDGQHDFDFEHGRWHVHLARLVKPLSHSTTWTTLDGTSVVRPVWGGLANLGELDVDGGGTHVQGLSLRVYDPKARQWRIHWANSRDGVLGPAMVGGFSGGRGEFYDQEDFEGRPIFVRFIFSDIAARSFKIEQAFSDDGGKSWETNWITTFTKDAEQTPPRSAPNATDAPHDFAFEVGTWTMHRRSLKDPLGGTEWTESDGATHIVHPVWGGRAALGELVRPGSPPQFAGSLLHTYDPQAKRWRLYWIDRESGRVGAPMTGTFEKANGEFYSQEDVRGVTALVRVRYTDITPTSFRTEQAWSLDGGRTWTPYAIDTFTRASSP
jgi:hypothetical protein